MAHQALYRRFRPDTFQKVVGQKHIVKTLVHQIESGSLSHAYLFTGTRGTGKTSVAKIFARAVNCLDPQGGSACGKCEVCVQLQNPSNLDIIEIDAASNNGVDEIRELKESVRYRPSVGKYKVYIIDEVHMLTPSAFNALLKTLEEPPEHVIFILATTEIHKLPQTVLSRCVRFDFRLLSEQELTEHLKNVFDEVGQTYDPEACVLIARHGEGSVRDMLSAAEMIQAYAAGKITAQIVEEALGTSSFDTLFSLAVKMLAANVDGLIAGFDALVATGKNVTQLAKDFGAFLLSVLFSKSVPEKSLGVSSAEYAQLKSLAEATDHKKLTRAIEIFTSLEGELRYTTQPKLLVGAAFVRSAELVTDVSLESTMARIRILEKELEKLKSGDFVATATDFDAKIQPPKPAVSEKLQALLKEATPVASAPLFQNTEDAEAAERKAEEKRRNQQLWQSVRALLKEREEFTLSSAAGDVEEILTDGDVFLVRTSSRQAYSAMTAIDSLPIVKKAAADVVGEATEFRCELIGDVKHGETSMFDKRTLEELFGNKLTKQ